MFKVFPSTSIPSSWDQIHPYLEVRGWSLQYIAQRLQSTYTVECRVSILGITITGLLSNQGEKSINLYFIRLKGSF